MASITKNCLICKKEFKAYNYLIRVGWGKYCSILCHRLGRRTSINRKCENCGKEFKVTLSRQNKAKFCSRNCYWKSLKGGSVLTKNFGEFSQRGKIFGENHPNWSGRTSIEGNIRNSSRYLEWRNGVFERDGHTCTKCGDKRGGNLEADHIIPLSTILKRFCVTNLKEAHGIDLIWDINNGRTLCIPCHRQTDTWGFKAQRFVYKDTMIQTIN